MQPSLGALLRPSPDWKMIDIDLLAANRIVHRLRTIRTLLPDDHFLGDMGRFAHNRLLYGLSHIDSLVRPVYVLHIGRIGNRAAHDFSMLFVEGNVGFHGLLDTMAPHTRKSRLDHPLAHIYLFFGHSQHFLARRIGPSWSFGRSNGCSYQAVGFGAVQDVHWLVAIQQADDLGSF